MGRFITPDTIIPDWTDPQSLNRYAYCRNNPLIYTDPSGNTWLVACGLWLVAGGDWISDKFDDLRSSLDPFKIYQDGGFMGLSLWGMEPVNHSFSYTFEGGFATGGGGNYYALSYGGGWQERGPNHGFYGYVGLGYAWKNGVSVGAFVRHNYTQHTTSFGVNVGYAHRSGASGGLGYDFTNNSWSASLGYSEPGLLREHRKFWDGMTWEMYQEAISRSGYPNAFSGPLIAEHKTLIDSYRVFYPNNDAYRWKPDASKLGLNPKFKQMVKDFFSIDSAAVDNYVNSKYVKGQLKTFSDFHTKSPLPPDASSYEGKKYRIDMYFKLLKKIRKR